MKNVDTCLDKCFVFGPLKRKGVAVLVRSCLSVSVVTSVSSLNVVLSVCLGRNNTGKGNGPKV